MSDETHVYSSDPVEQVFLTEAARRFGSRQIPQIDADVLICGARSGFSPEQCEAILWDVRSQAYICEILDDYEHVSGRQLPYGMASTIQQERAGSDPQWNTCLLGRIGCLPNLTDSQWNGAVASLPEEVRDTFDWNRYPAFIEDPATARSEFALAAGNDQQAIARWDPGQWDRTWKNGRFRIGARLYEGTIAVGVYSEQLSRYIDLDFMWSGGYSEMVHAGVRRGISLQHPELIDAHNGSLPESVFVVM